MPYFTHLHVHSHYSILDGMSKIPDLINKCKANGMFAMALTDHGNMFGIKDFVDTVAKQNGKLKEKIGEAEKLIVLLGKTEEAYAYFAKLDHAAELKALKEKGEKVDEKEKFTPPNPTADDLMRAAERSVEKIEECKRNIEAYKTQFFKPILGIEAYCARRTLYDHDKNVTEMNSENGKVRIVDRSGWHLILLAKNKQGYKNLCKLSSIAYMDGFYGTPRVDHNVLEQYHEGIICCSACLGGEVPQKILAGDLEGAEKSVLWFKNLYGDDYYLELQRHKTDKPNAATDTYEKQQRVNAVLIELARKHNIKIVATNDVHFVEEAHGEAHDHLICISTQAKVADENRMHYTKQEWLKSPEEMAAIFDDLPEALENTREVTDKIEIYSIDSDPLMPMFDIPESFGTELQWRERFTEEDLFNEFTQNQNHEVVMEQEAAEKKIKKLGGYEKLYRIKFEADYLEKLVWEGARMRYLPGKTELTEQEDIKAALTEEIRERIVFELHTIKTMGFPGYFLIVSDYIRAAREELGVSVGPGRGSAAGSVVAYCLKITDVDPLKYDLLFERFLNPDRISLPDIDVDFDDAGRGKVLDWITEKYGKEKVAHIITYGKMATKSVIADVGRVEDVSLDDVKRIKDYIPDKFPDGMKDENGQKLEKAPKINLKNCYKYVPELRAIMDGTAKPEDLALRPMLEYAEELEDTNRQIGIHACGVIIGADDLTKFAPICTIKDKDTGQDVVVTQYDGHVVENVGLIKMDFLGLKNLTIIKDALTNIKRRHGVDIDIDHIPIDDEKTYQLFCEGNTVGTFQFESLGMQKYLRELEPHVFEDLIAMNALYRPGPMDYIPDFIDRKQGRKPISYDIPCMEKYLKDTYGITVYQEQVMLLSRQLAGFTRGQSDTLRKAMGKKLIDKMNELEQLFYEGGEKNGHPREVLHKIWEDWKKFAAYAFNKSHATCYSWVAYQTAYLKANYPAEYMAAVLTSGQDDITRTTQIIEDCRKHGLDVLLPSVNESEKNFAVNANGQIRFGLQAISGMGEAAAEVIIKEREENGPYADIFDFLGRVDLHTINRKNVEVLVKAGAFDGLGTMHRAQYFYKEIDNDSCPTYLEKLVRWAVRNQENADSSQMSIFDMSEEIKEEQHPDAPQCEPWSTIEQCRNEKEVIGFYLSAHPLDEFAYEMKNFVNTPVSALKEFDKIKLSKITFAGMVADIKTGISQKNGNPYGRMTIEDYSGTYEIALFGKDYQRLKLYFEKGLFVYCTASVRIFKRKNDDGSSSDSPPKLYIDDIMLLGDTMGRFARGLSISVPLSCVNQPFCNKMSKILAGNKGSIPLKVFVTYNDMSLTMMPRGQKVDAKSFLKAIDGIDCIYNVKINQ